MKQAPRTKAVPTSRFPIPGTARILRLATPYAPCDRAERIAASLAGGRMRRKPQHARKHPLVGQCCRYGRLAGYGAVATGVASQFPQLPSRRRATVSPHAKTLRRRHRYSPPRPSRPDVAMNPISLRFKKRPLFRPRPLEHAGSATSLQVSSRPPPGRSGSPGLGCHAGGSARRAAAECDKVDPSDWDHPPSPLDERSTLGRQRTCRDGTRYCRVESKAIGPAPSTGRPVALVTTQTAAGAAPSPPWLRWLEDAQPRPPTHCGWVR